jgi:hypothetical protein
MPDISIWKDQKAREGFIERGKAVFEAIGPGLAGLDEIKVVGIEPESGDYFVGKTLGQANQAASEKYLDHWMYFVRVGDPEAAIPLPVW